MIIRDGLSEYLTQEDLKKLMIKIADLSPYKEQVFDSIFKTKEESDAFNVAIDDHRIARAAINHIFLNEKVYLEIPDFLPEVFKELSYKQQINFLKYYDAVKKDAIELGFLFEYEITRELLSAIDAKIIKFSFWALLLFIVWQASSATNYFLLIIMYVLFNMGDDTKNNLTIKRQNDMIMNKVNKKMISERMESSKKHLIDAGWIDKDQIDLEA